MPAWFDARTNAFVAPAGSQVRLPPLALSRKEALSEGQNQEAAEEKDGEEEEQAVGNGPGDGDERLLALDAFNSRHATRSTNARKLLATLQRKQEVVRSDNYDVAIGEVFRNRLLCRLLYAVRRRTALR